jgi:hypothetical protein
MKRFMKRFIGVAVSIAKRFQMKILPPNNLHLHEDTPTSSWINKRVGDIVHDKTGDQPHLIS